MTQSTRARTVLLIGAYANGNLGDMYQAEAIAGALLDIDPNLEVSSVSVEDRQVPYPSRNHRALPPNMVWDFGQLNSFDLILVGGGGLIAVPHRPFNDEDWVARIKTRMCALSLGVSADAARASRAFIERCELFSVRDEFSAEHVALMRDDAAIVSDPILLGSQIDDVGMPPPTGERQNLALIAGRVYPETVAFYQKLEDELMTSPADTVVAVNPYTDRASGLDEVVRRHRVNYSTSVTLLARQLMQRKFVVSERYHGCIFALRWGLPVYGIALGTTNVTPKITELYRRLELDEFLIRPNSSLERGRLAREIDGAFDFAAIHARLEEWRDGLRAYLRQCLRRDA